MPTITKRYNVTCYLKENKVQKNNFEIKLIDLFWLKSGDEENDLYAHGHVYVKIGDEIVCDENTLDVTVTAAGLYLLRSLSENYKKGNYDSQLLPCCGFVTYFDENLRPAISGCPAGIDWTITHLTEDLIQHTSDNGNSAIIKIEDYKKMVYDFVDKVEEFYQSSLPKILPKDEFELGAYEEIWEEWRELRNK